MPSLPEIYLTNFSRLFFSHNTRTINLIDSNYTIKYPYVLENRAKLETHIFSKDVFFPSKSKHDIFFLLLWDVTCLFITSFAEQDFFLQWKHIVVKIVERFILNYIFLAETDIERGEDWIKIIFFPWMIKQEELSCFLFLWINHYVVGEDKLSTRQVTKNCHFERGELFRLFEAGSFG